MTLASYSKYVDKKGKTTWRVVFDIPSTGDGKRDQERKSGFATKKEAEQYYMDFIRELRKGQILIDKKLTLSEWLSQWERDYVSVRNSPKTHEGYASIIQTHIVPVLGNVKLVDLNVSHVQNYVAQVRTKYSARYTRNHLSILKKSLNDAVRAGILSDNPANRVDQPRQTPVVYNLYSAEDMLKFLFALEGTQYHPFVIVALATGMRRGELVALKWSNIDFARHRITVSESHSSASKEYKKNKDESTKTKRIRVVAVATWLLDYLMEYRVKYNPDSEYVFIGYTSKRRICGSEIGRKINKIQDQLGFKRERIHDFRHWHASVLAASGVDVKTIQERLGHSRASTTTDIYMHLFESHDERPAEIIGSVLGLQ